MVAAPAESKHKRAMHIISGFGGGLFAAVLHLNRWFLLVVVEYALEYSLIAGGLLLGLFR